MEEKVAIERAAAEDFLSIYNKEAGSTFKITHIADAPDIRCQDDQGKPLNLEITLTEDRPGDIQATLGRSGQRSPQALREHLQRVREGKASPLERTSSLSGKVSTAIASRIRFKLLKRYGAHEKSEGQVLQSNIVWRVAGLPLPYPPLRQGSHTIYL